MEAGGTAALACSAMLLVGTFELVLDNKSRLSIPFTIRRKLGDSQSFYALPGRRQGTIVLYPEKVFEGLRSDLPPDDDLSDKTYAYRQFEHSQTALLEPDAQGRVVLPERLLKRTRLERDVVLIAVGDHLELWRSDDFAAFEEGMWPDYWQQRASALEEMKRLVEGNGDKSKPAQEKPAEQS
jgi:MraZ protein